MSENFLITIIILIVVLTLIYCFYLILKTNMNTISFKNVKQVIVYRRKYLNEKGETFSPRTGKAIAQTAHASISFLTNKIKDGKINLSEVEKYWLNNSFAKICLYVDTENELLDIYHQAKNANLETHIIKDSGRTEFHNVPQFTALAIGPDEAEKIDKITGNLKLF